jgi:hypothetical protein
MIQLMEDVYRDLDLENQSEHPDTSGWMNLFRHWSWSSMFRVTWAITYSVHGVRFKTFCEQALGLTVGRPANGAAVRVRETAKIGRLLNFLEARIVRRLYEAGIVGDSDQVIPFRMVTTNPQNAAQSITFTYGFAIVREAGNRRMLVYLRIQDHLRRLGLARKALSYLHQEYGVEETVRYQAIANARPRRTRTKSGRVPDPLDATITREGLDVLSRLLESVKGQI